MAVRYSRFCVECPISWFCFPGLKVENHISRWPRKVSREGFRKNDSAQAMLLERPLFQAHLLSKQSRSIYHFQMLCAEGWAKPVLSTEELTTAALADNSIVTR